MTVRLSIDEDAMDKALVQALRARGVDVITALDAGVILESVRKTGRLIVADTGWKSGGCGAEIVARVAEQALGDLKSPPIRIALPDCPTPTTPALANRYYPRAVHIVETGRKMMGYNLAELVAPSMTSTPLDIPGLTFRGGRSDGEVGS